MGLSDFLNRLVACLNDASVPHMLSGSLASSVHGEPRATQDVDLIVDLDADGLERLLAKLPEEHYYVSTAAALGAVRSRSQFNIIDFETGWKADLIVLKNRAFSREEFARRRVADALGVVVNIASPEDVILAKLEWAKKSGGSERQLRDVCGILAAPGQQLDNAYLDKWAVSLGVTELLEQVRDKKSPARM